MPSTRSTPPFARSPWTSSLALPIGTRAWSTSAVTVLSPLEPMRVTPQPIAMPSTSTHASPAANAGRNVGSERWKRLRRRLGRRGLVALARLGRSTTPSTTLQARRRHHRLHRSRQRLGRSPQLLELLPAEGQVATCFSNTSRLELGQGAQQVGAQILLVLLVIPLMRLPPSAPCASSRAPVASVPSRYRPAYRASPQSGVGKAAVIGELDHLDCSPGSVCSAARTSRASSRRAASTSVSSFAS